MSEREELSRKLLEENGLREGAVCGGDREGLRAIVEAERRRNVPLVRTVFVSWALFVVLLFGGVGIYFVAGNAQQGGHFGETMVSVVAIAGILSLLLAGIAFVVALVSTLAWGLRMAFGPREVDERLDRIEAQLARLEAARRQSGAEAGR